MTTTTHPVPVVLDFGTVSCVGSDDLNALVVLHERMKVTGRRLALINVRPDVAEIFALTRLNTLFDVRPAEMKA
jgi:anti-sigma B factor antagonist